MALYLSGLLSKKLGINHIIGAPSVNHLNSGALSGSGSISGKVLENGLPVSRRVMLYVRGTGAYVGQVRSDADGSYTFKNTDENLLYFVVSIDDSNNGVQYNLVGQDLISGNHDKRTAT